VPWGNPPLLWFKRLIFFSRAVKARPLRGPPSGRSLDSPGKKDCRVKKFAKEGYPMSHFIFKKLSYLILKYAFSVHNLLGPGLLESAYEGAFCVELTYAGIPFERQKVYPLYYKGVYIGAYIADLVVDDKVIVELKSVAALSSVMSAQILNYLKLSHIQVGYLMNFNAESLEWKRFVNQQIGA
jgi:GxxExxY protein